MIICLSWSCLCGYNKQIYIYIYIYLGWPHQCIMQETQNTSNFIYNAYKQICECGKVDFFGVVNFGVELSCARDDWKI